MKAQVRLVSLSISLALSSVAAADGGTGMQIVFNSFDTSNCNSQWQSDPNIVFSVGPTSGPSLPPTSPGQSVYASQILSLGPQSDPQHASFNLNFDHQPSFGVTVGVCPNGTGSAGTPTFNNGQAISTDTSDFNNQFGTNPTITINAKCNAGSPNTPVVTCDTSGFTNGSDKPKNGVVVNTPLPNVTLLAGQAYPRKTNPAVILDSYFMDYTPGNDYQMPGNRLYYSITIGNSTNSKSISGYQEDSSNLSNLALFSLVMPASSQLATGGDADNRTQIFSMMTSSDGGQTFFNQPLPPITDSSYSTYCGTKSAQGVYTCQVTVCGCNPATPAGFAGYCGNPSLLTSSETRLLYNFVCPAGATSKTTFPGGATPAIGTFNFYIEGPQFLPASIQDLAAQNGHLNNAGNNLVRFVVPINPTTTSISEIPLGINPGTDPVTKQPLFQYFKNSDGSALSGVTYSIVGLNGTPSTTNLPNGVVANPTLDGLEPILNTQNATSDWDPIKVNYGSNTSITPQQEGVALSIDGSNLKVDTTNFKPADGIGGVYQVTIAANETLVGSSETAYQTIYLNISSQNTSEYSATGTQINNGGSVVYTPMKPFNSAWMYLPGFLNATSGHQNPTMNSSTTTPTNEPAANSSNICQISDLSDPNTIDPCVTFSKTLSALDQAGTPIQALTPDIVWIAFQHSSKSYPAGTDVPIDNNFFTDNQKHIQQTVSFFKQANPNIKMIVTAEMDNSVKGALGNFQENIAPGTTDSYSQMDQIVWATVLPFVQTFTYPPAGDSTYSLDGLQFDVEPFSPAGNSADYYKRVADVLARYGKPVAIFAFPDATIPTDTATGSILPIMPMALGPLGIIMPSTYDVGEVTADKSNNPNDNQTYLSTYAANFMSPVSGGTYFDNNCHWSSSMAYNYVTNGNSFTGSNPITQLPIQSYCNIDITNTLYNNSVLMGILPAGKGNGDFTQIMQTYGSHFQLAVPSEGSAENYTAQIIYNPSCSQVDESAADNKGDAPLPIGKATNADPYGAVLGTTVCPKPTGNMVNTIPGLPSNFTANTTVPNDIASLMSSSTLSSTDKLNAIMPYLYELKSLNYYIGEDTNCASQSFSQTIPNETPAQACRYILFLANPNNEGNTTAKTYVPSSGATPSQDAYIQSVLDFAQGKNTDFPQGNIALGTPATNPSNLGLGLYALSSEDVTGCLPDESHPLKPNCILALPITTMLNDPTGGTIPPVGAKYWVSNLQISANPTGASAYTLNWTLSCQNDQIPPATSPSEPGIFAVSQLYNSSSDAPLSRLTQWISNPKCGQTYSSQFSLSKGTFPTVTNASLALAEGGTFQNLSPISMINVTNNQPAAGLNPVWSDVFNYTQPFSISAHLVGTPSSTSYVLGWTLNCLTPPTEGVLATSSLYAEKNASPLSRHTQWIANPTCGSSYQSTFKGNFSSTATQASLVLEQGGTFQEITPEEYVPITIPASK